MGPGSLVRAPHQDGVAEENVDHVKGSLLQSDRACPGPGGTGLPESNAPAGSGADQTEPPPAEDSAVAWTQYTPGDGRQEAVILEIR